MKPLSTLRRKSKKRKCKARYHDAKIGGFDTKLAETGSKQLLGAVGEPDADFIVFPAGRFPPNEKIKIKKKRERERERERETWVRG